MQNKKNILKNIMFVVFGLFFGGVVFLTSDIIFENIERQFYHIRDFYVSDTKTFCLSKNKILVYEMKKNGVFARYKFRPSYKINYQGFRDIDFKPKESDKDKLILVLGDSITFAGTISDNSRYTRVLENTIKDKKTLFKYHVYNMGIDGYNTIQEAENLKENGLKYGPDIVIFTYCLNDNYNYCDTGIYYAASVSSNKVNQFLCRSKGYRTVYKLINKKAGEERTNIVKLYRKYGKIDASNIPDEEIGFKVISELQKKYGFKCYLFIIPYFTDFINYDESVIHDRIKAALKKYPNIICFDLKDDFVKISKDANIFRDDVIHPNKYGHKLMANFIYDRLEKDGVLE